MICQECGNEGVHENGDVMQTCSACTAGAARDYDAEKGHGQLPFLLGALTQYLDEQVEKYGRLDNRERE